MRRLTALFLTSTLLLSGVSAVAQNFTEEEIKQLALQAILENPDIVMEAVAIIQQRQEAEESARAQATISENRSVLEFDPNAPVLGNPDGDVTVVEFFDYNCPYCRRAGAEVAKLTAADDNVRIVYREWPILGEGSDFAARAALASRAQGKYGEFHEALMGARGRVDERIVMQLAAGVGLDIDTLRADMEAPEIQEHIDTSMQLARELGFSGTPSFVIGEARAPGLIEAAQMLELVEAARDGG